MRRFVYRQVPAVTRRNTIYRFTPIAEYTGLRGLCTISDEKNSNIGMWAKGKTVMKKYGLLAFSFHSSVYVITLGTLYSGIYYDIIPLQAVTPILESVLSSTGLDRVVGKEGIESSSIFASAWILAKFTEPIRLPLTIYWTPRISKLLIQPFTESSSKP